MTDQDLDNIFKNNIGTSQAAALRGVWDAGYNYAIGASAQFAQTQDVSTVQNTTPTVVADVPNNIQTA